LSISILDSEKNHEIKVFTLVNSNGMKAKLTNLGATIISLFVPDKNNNLVDVVLGFDNPENYFENPCSFGVTVGRNSSRIKEAKFSINGEEYFLDKNENNNNLHSGFNRYGARIWNYELNEEDNSVKFSLISPDGDQGFPGNFNVSVTYKLTEDNGIEIIYNGISDKDTVANMTNHSYFNLNGHDSGTAMNHKLCINAFKYIPVDNESIPLGYLAEVKDTPMDFTEFRTIGDDIDCNFEQLKLTRGYDHGFAIDKSVPGVEKIATLIGDISNITMEVYTDCVGVQFYAGNYIEDVPQIGKNNCIYKHRSGICLETAYFPDAINQPNFASPILKANEIYNTKTIYKFL